VAVTIVVGHISACFIGGRIAGASAKDIAIVALEAATTAARSATNKLAEDVHYVLLDLSTSSVTDR
jgi:hypothetical protein